MGWRLRNTSDMTWIEVLVVLSMAWGLTAIEMGRAPEDPKADFRRLQYEECRAGMRILEAALQRYKQDNGIYPSTEQGLEALVRKPATGPLPPHWPAGGYLEQKDIPIDPWGNWYVYSSPGRLGRAYDLKSLGGDGLEGGEGPNADIHS